MQVIAAKNSIEFYPKNFIEINGICSIKLSDHFFRICLKNPIEINRKVL